MSMSPLEKLTFKSLHIQPVPGCHSQYLRPMVNNIDKVTVDGFHGLVETATEVTPALLQHLHHAVMPSKRPQQEAFIPSGWQASRYVFELRVQVELFIGAIRDGVIRGYTDSDRTLDDPELKFYINSIEWSQATLVVTPFGRENERAVVGSHQLLRVLDPQWVAMDEAVNHMRPEDIFARLTSSHFDPQTVLDMRTTATPSTRLNKRTNNIPTFLLTEVLNSYAQAQTTTDTEAGFSIYDVARGRCAEMPATRDYFLAALAEHDPEYKGCFTLQVLREMLPNLQVSTAARDETLNEKIKNSTPWNGSDFITAAATQIVHATAALMSTHGVVGFQYHYGRLGDGEMYNSVSFDPAMPNSQSTADIPGKLIQELRQTVLNALSYGGQIPLKLKLVANLASFIQLDISVDNGETVKSFVAPMYADALFAPVLNASTVEYTQLANDLLWLCGIYSDRQRERDF